MISIKVPPLGESIVEATVSRWLKKEGDAIAAGETLVELETDKITVEVPAMSAGVLTKRAHAEGDVVKVDDLLAEIDESASAGAAAPAAKPPEAAAKAEPAKPAPAAPAAAEVRASPAAQRVAADQGVDLSKVQGTGRGGVISKPDVIEQGGQKPSEFVKAASTQPPAQAAAQQAVQRAPASGERETREKMTTRRKRIAEHLLESQHATAHLTTFNEIDMTNVSQQRSRSWVTVGMSISFKGV
jgi:2-oxoglutarate dehydrogenase E2 component (dihydrolipoamide succinyltransferase)